MSVVARRLVVLALIASACSSEPEPVLVGGGDEVASAAFDLGGTAWSIIEKDGNAFGPPAMSMSFWEQGGVLGLAIDGDCGQGAGLLKRSTPGFVVRELNWSDSAARLSGCAYGIETLLLPGTHAEVSLENNLLTISGGDFELIGEHFASQSVNHDDPSVPAHTTPPPRARRHDSIRIAKQTWSSQLVGAEVIGGVLEAAGYAVEYVPQDLGAPVYPAMCIGDVDILHEVWETSFGVAFEDSFGVAFEEQVASGCILDWAPHDAVIQEGAWYPSYMDAECAGLPDWQALKDCAELFATSGESGRFLSGPIAWQKPVSAAMRE